MTNIIDDCTVTRTSSTVLCPFIPNSSSEEYKQYKKIHDGIDIRCVSVHSACQGVVSFIGTNHEDGTQEVTVLYDARQGMRYCHLEKVLCKLSDIVDTGEWIAEAKDFVHFEYIDNSDKDRPIWPVRVGSQEFFKHDPTKYATGELVIPNRVLNTVYTEWDPENLPSVNLSDDMMEEFDGNREAGDNEPNGIGGGIA